MSDLIDRQMAIDALGEEPEVWSNDNEYELGMRNQWLYDRKTLESLPPAQPERKMGKWIPHESVFGGSKEMVYTCGQCGHNIGFHMENYCPSCGANMRGESDG